MSLPAFAEKRDILVIFVILALAGATWLAYTNYTSNEKTYAEIYYDSKLIKKVSLDGGKEEEFRIKEAPAVLFKITKDGKIAFIESDCPDKVCINTGKIDKNGQFAACLPNKVVVRIVKGNIEDDEEPDVVV